MDTLTHSDHPFYGYEILRLREQEYIQNFLKKYAGETVTEELKQKIWEDLQMEKYFGRVTIPFKVVIRKDNMRKYPDIIEVILDTKV